MPRIQPWLPLLLHASSFGTNPTHDIQFLASLPDTFNGKGFPEFSHGGHLVSIRSRSEMDALAAYQSSAAAETREHWIGIHWARGPQTQS